MKGAVCWRTATNHVESCESAAVVSEWSDACDVNGGVGGGEGGVQVAADVRTGQIVSTNNSILLARRVPLQCDTAGEECGAGTAVRRCRYCEGKEKNEEEEGRRMRRRRATNT